MQSPRVKMVKIFNPFSLKEICVQFVSSNMGKWSVAVNSSKKCDQEEIFSPFDVLSSVLLEDIIHALPLMTKQVLELIITPHLKNLNLHETDETVFELEPNDVPYLLNLASLRCPDLKAVDLHDTYLKDNIEICVHLCALKFEKLQKLDISETDAEDSCLQVLGMHCKDLRELNVDFCSKITDAGIKGLCVSGICKSIEGLYIRGTQITKKGIKIALKHLHFLQALKVFDNHEVVGSASSVPVQIIAEMILDEQNSNLKRKYSLNCVCLFDYCHLLGHMPYINGSLGLVASLCPFVTILDINLVSGLTNSDLLELLFLENVNRLEIYADSDSAPTVHNPTPHMVTFKDGVVPLLKRFGSSLEVLVLYNLEEVTAVKIPMIIDFCPKLKSLDINREERLLV